MNYQHKKAVNREWTGLKEAISAMGIEAEEVEAALPDNFIINHT